MYVDVRVHGVTFHRFSTLNDKHAANPKGRLYYRFVVSLMVSSRVVVSFFLFDTRVMCTASICKD